MYYSSGRVASRAHGRTSPDREAPPNYGPSLQILLGHDLAHEHILSLVHVPHTRVRLLVAQMVLRVLIRVALPSGAPVRGDHFIAQQRRGRWL